MEGRKQTVIGILAAILLIGALVYIGSQYNAQRQSQQNVLPTERPAWFGGGGGGSNTTGAPGMPTSAGPSSAGSSVPASAGR
ncbi:MAG: hypothetical protein RMJ43_16445 [Chloroherpetonaceae bacterium]|nr:hypothetical protein [Chthonomonadaceae bacterium]MDW8209420.1 hypothetical protein [Chloroherpetonaceae bacterium]